MEIRLPFFIAVALLCGGCGTHTSREQVSTVKIAVVAGGMPYLPIYLAHELRYDAEHGIQIEIDDVPGGAKALQALFGGSVDVAAGSYEFAIQMALEGRDLQSFLIIAQRTSYALAVSPASRRKIRQLSDLDGAVVGISAPGSGTHNFLQFLLLRNHIPLNRVRVTGVGVGPSAVAAFERGMVDAAVITGTAFAAARRRFPGVKVLTESITSDGMKSVYGSEIYVSHGLLAPSKWLRKHRETAAKVAESVKQATDWMRVHTPEEVRAHMPARFRSSETEDDLEAIRAAQSILSVDGLITPEQAEFVRNAMSVVMEKVRNTPIELSRTYTNEFVQPEH